LPNQNVEDSSQEPGKFAATKEADMLEVTVKQTLRDINKLSDMLGDPTFSWLAKEKTIAKVQELNVLLLNSLDQEAIDDLKELQRTWQHGYDTLDKKYGFRRGL